jgi:hypothetical protein
MYQQRSLFRGVDGVDADRQKIDPLASGGGAERKNYRTEQCEQRAG